MDAASVIKIEAMLAVAVPIIIVLATNGFLNTFTAPLAAAMITRLLQLNEFESIVFVLSVWMATFTVQSIMEFFTGESSDLNLILLPTYQGTQLSNKSRSNLALVFIRIAIVIAFIYLPIGKPPLLIGPLVWVLGYILIMFNNQEHVKLEGIQKSFLYTIIQMGLIGSAIAIYLTIGMGNSSVVPLATIIAISIPELLLGSTNQTRPNDEESFSVVADPLRTFMVLVMSWMTPGYSMATTSAMFLPNSPNRIATAALASAAVEGWVIHITLIDAAGGSGKTTLGEILKGQMLLGSSPLQGEELAILPLALLCAAMLTLLLIAKLTHHQINISTKNSRLIMTSIQIVTIIAILKLYAIPFLVASIICYGLNEFLKVPAELKSLAPLAIIS